MKKSYLAICAGVLLLLLVFTGCNKAGSGSSALAASKEDAWGVSLSAAKITPKGLTIVCTQKNGSPKGELQTGQPYWLEKKENGQWVKVKTLVEDGQWTMEAWGITKNKSVEWEVNWEDLYGALPRGEYRIGKTIVDFQSPEACSENPYYADFEIRKVR